MTIKEIAKQAGVGVSTVSRYLNDGYVSEEKRKVIAKIIKDNNYQRNHAAVTMRGKSNEIAIIIQRISSVTASHFLDGVVNKCLEFDLQPKIYTVRFDDELQSKYIDEVIKKKYMAVIVFSYKNNFNVDYKNLYVVGQKSKLNPCIYIQNKEIYSKLTTQVLTDNKIKKVYIFGIELVDEALTSRMQGTKESCIKYGVEYEFIDFGFDNNDVEIKIEYGAYYVCMTDSQAYRIIESAQKQGLNFGTDYFISGFGNYLASNILGLTSAHVDYEGMGERVVEKINNNSYTDEIFDYQLIYRKSTNNPINTI